MRIGLLINALAAQETGGPPGVTTHGVGIYIRELVSALLHEYSECEFVLISEKPYSLPEDLSTHPRVHHACVPFRLCGCSKAGLWREWVAARERIDVLHEPEPSGGTGRLSNYPLVLSIHDLTPMIFPGMFRPALRWTFNAFAGRNIARADAVIASSEQTLKDMERLFPGVEKKARVIHLAGQSLDYDTPADDGLLTSLGVRKPYILSVATIEPRKNHVALLDAFTRIRENGLDFRLVLTGQSGWKNSDVHSHPALERYGSDIIFAGTVDPLQLAQLYRGAFVFVYPTIYEGFGMPPIEAAAAGTPVIVGSNSCLPEILGDTAYFVSPKPTGAEIAEAITALVKDPALHSRLSDAGKQRAGRYSWRKTAALTMEVYESVLRNRSVR